MTDIVQRIFYFANDGIFVVLVGIVIASGDVGTTHTDTIQCQGKDVAGFSEVAIL